MEDTITTMTIKEAARYADLSETQVRRYIDTNRVTHSLKNGVRHIEKESLDKVLQEIRDRQQQPKKKPLHIDWRPGEEPTIDGALLHVKAGLLKLARVFDAYVNDIPSDEISLPILTNAMQKATACLESLIEYAPMLDFRQKFEGAEDLRKWIDQQPDVRPETIELVTRYEQELINTASEKVGIPVKQDSAV